MKLLFISGLELLIISHTAILLLGILIGRLIKTNKGVKN